MGQLYIDKYVLVSKEAPRDQISVSSGVAPKLVFAETGDIEAAPSPVAIPSS
jgi:hypothetical protein